MNFYSMLSAYYDELFTLKPATVEFVRSKSVGRKALLDVGCGTGLLSHALASEFDSVEGVDLDGEMVRRSLSKSSCNEMFRALNMMDLRSTFTPGYFDIITCLGNTIAHLSSNVDVTSVLHSFYELLADGGVAVIQIVNFDRVIKHGAVGLPFLETPDVEFLRNYIYDGDAKVVEFSSSIRNKENGEQFDNSVELLPLLKSELETLLFEAGFKSVEIYGDYQCGDWSDETGPTIAVAYK